MRQSWLADPVMMSYNAGWLLDHPGYDQDTGCIDWPESQWPQFDERLLRPVEQAGYYYVAEEPGEFVGHVHYEVIDTIAWVGLNVIPTRRGQGLGTQLLELAVNRIWQDTEVTEAVNEFEDERIAAVRVHRRGGFVPDPGTTSRFGRPTRTWRLARPA